MNFAKSVYGKKRISKEEYERLPEEEKKRFKFQLLDPDFSPGPGDDISFSYRITQAGLNILQANFWVDHHRLTENFNDHIEDIKKRNAEYFREKHHIANWSKEIDNYPLYKAMEYLNHVNIEMEKQSELKFLDYGSGNGRDAFHLLMRGGTIIDCCDIALENLKIAAKNIGKFFGLRTNFILLFRNDRIPVLDGTYDFINCNGVIHHASNPKEIIKELHRVLKPNGQMAIMIYTEKLYEDLRLKIESLMKEKNWTKEQAMGWFTDNAPYATYYTEEQGRELLKEFKIEEVKTYHDGQFRIYKCRRENEILA